MLLLLSCPKLKGSSKYAELILGFLKGKKFTCHLVSLTSSQQSVFLEYTVYENYMDIDIVLLCIFHSEEFKSTTNSYSFIITRASLLVVDLNVPLWKMGKSTMPWGTCHNWIFLCRDNYLLKMADLFSNWTCQSYSSLAASETLVTWLTSRTMGPYSWGCHIPNGKCCNVPDRPFLFLMD